jgi:hypothetical protein
LKRKTQLLVGDVHEQGRLELIAFSRAGRLVRQLDAVYSPELIFMAIGGILQTNEGKLCTLSLTFFATCTR